MATTTQQWPQGDHTASRHVAGYMQMQLSSDGMDKSRRPKIDATRKCMSWNRVVQSIKDCTLKEGNIMYHRSTLVTTRDQMAPVPPPLTPNQNIPKHLSLLVYPAWNTEKRWYLDEKDWGLNSNSSLSNHGFVLDSQKGLLPFSLSHTMYCSACFGFEVQMFQSNLPCKSLPYHISCSLTWCVVARETTKRERLEHNWETSWHASEGYVFLFSLPFCQEKLR